MKNLLMIFCLFMFMSQTFANSNELSSEFVDSDTVEYWILETGSN